METYITINTHLATIFVILGVILCITLIPYWVGRLVLRIIFKDDVILFISDNISDKIALWLMGIVSTTISLVIGWILSESYIIIYNTINTITTNK